MSSPRLANVDLNLLLVLDALLETRSTVLAAEKLGRTQSAISHALNRLRELFRDQLFVRIGQSFQPTAFATSLEEPLRETLGATERLLFRSPSFDVSKLDYTFNLSMNDVLQAVLLPHFATRVRQQAPQVEFIVRAPDGDSPRSIQRGDMDAELEFGTEPTSVGRLVRQVLRYDTLVCIVRREDIRFGNQLRLDEFLAADHVGVGMRGRAESVVDRALEHIGHTRRVLWWTTHAFTALRIAMNTGLMATLPASFLRAVTLDSSMRSLQAPSEISLAPWTMVWSATRRADPVHIWLRSVIKECCEPIGKNAVWVDEAMRQTPVTPSLVE